MKALIAGLMVTLLLTVATTSHALPMPVAKTIVLTQNVGNTFQIAEVQAFETGTGINVASQANGGVASASSSDFGTIPGDANDGNTDGAFGNGSVWHSAGGAGSTLTIDLADPSQLDSITIFGRTDCCEDRQDDFNLEIFDSAGESLFFQRVVGLGTSPSAFGTISGLAPFTAIPEPVTGTLGLIGMAGLLMRRRRAA